MIGFLELLVALFVVFNNLEDDVVEGVKDDEGIEGLGASKACCCGCGGEEEEVELLHKCFLRYGYISSIIFALLPQQQYDLYTYFNCCKCYLPPVWVSRYL